MAPAPAPARLLLVEIEVYHAKQGVALSVLVLAQAFLLALVHVICTHPRALVVTASKDDEVIGVEAQV